MQFISVTIADLYRYILLIVLVWDFKIEKYVNGLKRLKTLFLNSSSLLIFSRTSSLKHQSCVHMAHQFGCNYKWIYLVWCYPYQKPISKHPVCHFFNARKVYSLRGAVQKHRWIFERNQIKIRKSRAIQDFSSKKSQIHIFAWENLV